MKTELYKKTNDQLRYWSIEPKNDTYIITHGVAGGKLQTKITTCTARNIGKNNETTPEQQAIKEAKAKVTKQLKEGYVTDMSGESDILLPMKVSKYEDRKQHITFPCIECIKYDGLNATLLYKDKKLRIISRGGEDYPVHEHFKKEITQIMKVFSLTRLSAELYIHNTPLNLISSYVRTKKPESNQLKAILFDTQQTNTKISGRIDNLIEIQKYIEDYNFKYVETADCKIILNQEQLDTRYEQHLINNYEGSVIYLNENMYQHNKRSLTVMKRKPLEDSEFEIVGHKLDKDGKLPIFLLKTEDDVEFGCKVKGSHKEQLEMLSNISNLIGKKMTVNYERLSGKTGAPLKPVGKLIRENYDIS
jgi:DNA ligase-1